MEDILDCFRLSNDRWKSYATVRGKFESYFMKKRSIVFDRISFFQKGQEEREPITLFVNDVYVLAKLCNFGVLHHEMVRDIPIAGIRKKRLLEPLHLDGDLTVEKAVTCIQQTETVHQQQVFPHGHNTRQFPIDLVNTSRRPGRNTSDAG